MGWLTKLLKGSNHKYSGRTYEGKYGHDRDSSNHDGSVVITISVIYRERARKHSSIFSYKSDWSYDNGKLWVQDDLTDIEREEIDRAIALSLSEEDYKGKKVVGKVHVFANQWLKCFFV